MTMRQLGETAIKLLGVYYAASAVFDTFSVIASLIVPFPDSFPPVSHIVALNLMRVAGQAAVSILCLLRAEAVARRLFEDERIPSASLSRSDWLFIGILLIGLVWVISGIPDILYIAGKAIWFAEGSRQLMFKVEMRQSFEALVHAGLAIVVGLGVTFKARRLARQLDTGV